MRHRKQTTVIGDLMINADDDRRVGLYSLHHFSFLFIFVSCSCPVVRLFVKSLILVYIYSSTLISTMYITNT